MNNTVLKESDLNELERFGRYLENLTLPDDGNELRQTLRVLDEYYKDILKQVKS
jgi:hypothetical protein